MAARCMTDHLQRVVSTDFIFDGTSKKPYLESDLPNPQSDYGQTKLEGEIEKLKEIFTTVSQEHIFNNCPFLIKKEDGQFKTRINHLGILKMFIQM